MPNVNSPMGLVPRLHSRGGLHRIAPVPYQIASALASNIYRGSAVIPVTTNKRIDVAAAGNRLVGVFHGVSYVNAQGEPVWNKYWASGTTLLSGTVAEAEVFDDPDILFGVQVSSATGLVAGNVGAFADLVIGTGSAVTGNSGDMLDQTTLTETTATGGQLRVEALDPIQGNDYGQYAKALVRINEHTLGAGTTAGMNTNAI